MRRRGDEERRCNFSQASGAGGLELQNPILRCLMILGNNCMARCCSVWLVTRVYGLSVCVSVCAAACTTSDWSGDKASNDGWQMDRRCHPSMGSGWERGSQRGVG